MATKSMVNWLFKAVCKVPLEDPTLQPFNKATIRRWLSDLNKIQLEHVKKCVANMSPDACRQEPVFFSIVQAIAEMYRHDSDYMALPIEVPLGKMSIGISNNAEPAPIVETVARATPQNPHLGGKHEDVLFSKALARKWLSSPSPTNLEKNLEPAVKGAKGDSGSTAQIDGRERIDLGKLYNITPKSSADFLPRFESITFTRDVNVQELAVEDMIKRLNAITSIGSPLSVLQRYLETFFIHGLDIAGFALENLRWTMTAHAETPTGPRIKVEMKSTRADDNRHAIACKQPWNSCEVVAATILSLASSINANKLHKNLAREFTLGCSLRLTTRMELMLTPSASLKKRVSKSEGRCNRSAQSNNSTEGLSA